MLRCSKTKGTTKVVPFALGSAAQRAAPPFGDSNARGRQSRPCAILHRLRRLRIYGAKAPPARRPVGVILSKCCRKSKISILTVPSTSEQSPLCSDVFLCLWQKRRHPPAPLLLLSNCDPLRWARSWCAALRAAFFSIKN